ncbi:uncharacterized protein THITE_2084946 [Thermothielavioides terrestris NRRL 8126]|uniref:Uncharacterized protein n=1 Tax=Thermothielavioides terrestris (strain ATCC 38088 / NRRL 8126) TaxID=578455 RepID=G2QS39_THETT|nr:uncharacterized protein THITE_2084946 [Thermothielavioides terrestris NRRL 8126]AEO63429.1 hypothetical protein THITE_2084946 [Thermothielavioides terrestris NRRL 8126]
MTLETEKTVTVAVAALPTLDSPKDWPRWISAVRQEANNLRVWHIIDPDTELATEAAIRSALMKAEQLDFNPPPPPAVCGGTPLAARPGCQAQSAMVAASDFIGQLWSAGKTDAHTGEYQTQG